MNQLLAVESKTANLTSRWRALKSWQRWSAVVLVSLAVVSFARVITPANDLTASGTIERTLVLMLPIMLAALGGLFAERAGIVNIGLEGMMILGTWSAGFLGFHYGPWAALLGGLLGGALGGLIHAIVTVGFGVNHVISGVAINLLVGAGGSGLVRYLSTLYFKGRGSGSGTNSPGFSGVTGTINLPFFGTGFHTTNVLQNLADRHYFLLSDIASVLNGIFSSLQLEIVIAFLLVPLTFWVLWRTRFGLQLRACGERPSAADSLGVPVHKIQYIAVTISGALAGMGGAILVLDNSGIYQEGQTANRGFIGLAALIFGNWRPSGIVTGAALFGFTDALQLRSDTAVIGLYLVGFVISAFMATLAWRSGNKHRVERIAAIGAVLLIMFIGKYHAPVDIVKALPYIATLIVLTVSSQRLRPPAAAGMPWRKGMLG